MHPLFKNQPLLNAYSFFPELCTVYTAVGHKEASCAFIFILLFVIRRTSLDRTPLAKSEILCPTTPGHGDVYSVRTHIFVDSISMPWSIRETNQSQARVSRRTASDVDAPCWQRHKGLLAVAKSNP